MHNFVYLAQRRSQEFSCEPNFGKGVPRPPLGCASEMSHGSVFVWVRAGDGSGSLPMTHRVLCFRVTTTTPGHVTRRTIRVLEHNSVT